MEYNVLWIDDEHETLTGTKGRAKRNGINLIPFRSLDGIDELERNYSYYDGVLLDAKFWESEGDVAGSEDTDNVHRAKERILQLPKKFEIFVLTGQAEAYDDRQFTKAFLKVYKKADDADIERLFKDIKDAANKQEDTQIRHEYKPVFDGIKSNPNLQKHSNSLIGLLKNIDTHQDYTSVRKTLESLFKALSEVCIIPPKFVGEQGWINGTSKFISCTHPRYEFHDKDFIHSTISETLSYVLNLVQDASHNEGELKYKIDDYIRVNKSGYLYKSVVFSLLEILVYFCQLIKENPNPDQNQKRWSKLINPNEDWRTGHIAKFSKNGWATFICDDKADEIGIHPNEVNKHNLTKNKEIEIRVELNHQTQKFWVKEIIV